MSQYHIVININKNDAFVEQTINEYIYNFLNVAEYNIKKYKIIIDFINFLKENKSFIYYLIYDKGKFLQTLPFKIFWNYQNIEDEYVFRNQNDYIHRDTEEEAENNEENEYLFKNINLENVNFFMKENELYKRNETETERERERERETGMETKNENVIEEKNKEPKLNINFQKRNFSYFNEKKFEQKIFKCQTATNSTNTQSNTEVEKEKTKKIEIKQQTEKDENQMKANDENQMKEKDENQMEAEEDINKEETEMEKNNFIEKTHIVEENDFLYNIKILDIKEKTEKKKKIRINKLPVSSIGRAAALGKIVFDVARNSSFEYIKNILIKNKKENSIITETNAEIIARGLSKMRGVVLKLGQMISLQEEHISPILGKALKIAYNSADAMPVNQLKQILKQELGNNFEKKFDSFNYDPFANASIGQVHEAFIKGKKVAVKIQYPGVIESIESDIKNVLFINQYTNLILKSLYIENICREIKKELICECDYINEAKYYIYFKNIFKNSKYFYIPSVYSDYVTKRVLVTSYVDGISIEEVPNTFPQNVRDSIGQRILYLCLHELFVFKIMNTDPNLGNYIYDYKQDKLCLIDFGATRTYNNEFVDEYLRLVKASTEEDEKKIYHYSYMLNFFNGKENEEMKNSHIRSVILVGEPFKSKTYDFGVGDLAKRVYNLLPKIINNRLVPPRSEIYTLHRKLSGSYLICMKLKAKVQAADIFHSIYKNYVFSTKDTYNDQKANTI